MGVDADLPKESVALECLLLGVLVIEGYSELVVCLCAVAAVLPMHANRWTVFCFASPPKWTPR